MLALPASMSPVAWTALTQRLEADCRAVPFETGWSLIDLTAGRSASWQGDRVFPSASTRKIAVLMTLLGAVARGELSMDREIVIDERYRDEIFTGLLQHLTPGLSLPLRDVLTLMISVSDNLSTAHAIDLVGLDRVNEFCEALGLRGTRHRHALIPELPADHPIDATNATTPDDQARLLRAILDGASDVDGAARLGCTPELCEFALDALRAQFYADAMPALLPKSTVVAHKTGSGWRDVSDVGVVFRAESPLFVLAVFVDDVPESLPDGTPGRFAARGHIAQVARLCWEAFETPAAVVTEGGANAAR